MMWITNINFFQRNLIWVISVTCFAIFTIFWFSIISNERKQFVNHLEILWRNQNHYLIRIAIFGLNLFRKVIMPWTLKYNYLNLAIRCLRNSLFCYLIRVSLYVFHSHYGASRQDVRGSLRSASCNQYSSLK